MGDRPDWDHGEGGDGNWHREGPGPDRNPNWANRRGPPGPPGPGRMIDDAALIPKVPYYDLPAGLMAPLVNVSCNKTNSRIL